MLFREERRLRLKGRGGDGGENCILGGRRAALPDGTGAGENVRERYCIFSITVYSFILSDYRSVYQSIYPSIHLSVYLRIHIHTKLIIILCNINKPVEKGNVFL